MEKADGDPQAVIFEVPDPTAQGTEDTASVTIKTRSLKASADFNGFVQDEFERSKGQSGYENDSSNKDSSVHRYFVEAQQDAISGARRLSPDLQHRDRSALPATAAGRNATAWNDTFDADAPAVFAS